MKRTTSATDPSGWQNSPWGKPRKRSLFARLFGKAVLLLIVGGFVWVFVALMMHEPGKPFFGRRGSGQTTRGASLPTSWKDGSSQQASAYLAGVQKGRSQGRVYGIADGSVGPLTGDEAARMGESHKIRQALRTLQSDFRAAQELRKAASAKVQPAEIDRMIADAKARAVKDLRDCRASAVRQEAEAFEKFLGTDSEFRALFGEVSRAASE